MNKKLLSLGLIVSVVCLGTSSVSAKFGIPQSITNVDWTGKYNTATKWATIYTLVKVLAYKQCQSNSYNKGNPYAASSAKLAQCLEPSIVGFSIAPALVLEGFANFEGATRTSKFAAQYRKHVSLLELTSDIFGATRFGLKKLVGNSQQENNVRRSGINRY